MDEPVCDPHVVPRIAFLFVLQLYVTPVLFLVLRWRMPTLFIMFLATSLVALTTNAGTPPVTLAAAVFGAVLLPFFASLFGLALGFAVSAVFDHFKADEEALRNSGTDPQSYVNVQRIAQLVAAMFLVGAYIIVVAVPDSALVGCIIAHMAVALVVFAGMVLFSKRTPQLRRAWIVYGILYVVVFAIVAFTLAFSNDFFWTFFVIVLVYFLALVVVLLLVLLFSNDTKAALIAAAETDGPMSAIGGGMMMPVGPATFPSSAPSRPGVPPSNGNSNNNSNNNTSEYIQVPLVPLDGTEAHGAKKDNFDIFQLWRTKM